MTKEIAGEVRVLTIFRGVMLLLELVLTVMVVFIARIVFWLPGLVR